MELNLNYIVGQTPLDEDEKDGLIPPIDSRVMLNELEQDNINRAIVWARNISPSLKDILSENFLQRVHARMFGNIWNWAGTYRKTNKNIGVDKYEISSALKNVFDDCLFWIENNTFNADEIAVRFKHRIVLVHPFANGNGRHSRLMGDILIQKHFKGQNFSWGNMSFVEEGEARKAYLAAIRKADQGDYKHLILFARS
jgi:Fic-DOC domain mobile mystery protein B